MKQYFSDPDSSFDQLSIDFLDDQTDPSDDNHQYFITIDSEGFARYDPPTTQVNEDISSWTIENVRFVVRDVFDESAVSRDVTFFVQAIKFDVTRENAGESVGANSVGNPSDILDALFRCTIDLNIHEEMGRSISVFCRCSANFP